MDPMTLTPCSEQGTRLYELRFDPAHKRMVCQMKQQNTAITQLPNKQYQGVMSHSISDNESNGQNNTIKKVHTFGEKVMHKQKVSS